jgi:hypothetical protein
MSLSSTRLQTIAIRSLVTFFGGVGLGAANFVVGWAIGLVVRCISTRGRFATR